MKGLVPKDECRRIIDYFESHPELHHPGSAGWKTDSKIKKDTEIGCEFEKYFGPCWISKYLKIAKKEYEKQFFSYFCLQPWDVDFKYKIQRYYPNEGYFVIHCENSGTADKYDGSRLLAWMIYLNDVSDGGFTEFPDQKKKYKPRTGDMLVWPAYFTHPHRGITSKTQTKYIVTGWFNFLTWSTE